MANSPRFQENQIPGLIPSPKSYSPNNSSTSSSSTTSGSNNNGLHHHHHSHHRPPTTPTGMAPQSPVPITRSEPNSPYPTTFVQADSSSFKQVVQMLTGSSETAKHASGSARPDSTSAAAAAMKNHSIPPIKSTTKKDKSASRLYERRNSLKNFKLSPLAPGFVNRPVFSSNSPRTGTPELLSPSLLDFPSLALSPVTPLIPDPFNRSPHSGGSSSSSNLDVEAEEKAIAKKGFYFHPSPSTTPRESEPPRLLPLFPVTSPRVSGSISSDS
ncbi:OLC1v1021498C1 [Oldenlandia corymbosa var. corymbosa]|uniref:OLC1v1021498C1 n=1 Tax=Oldenlandia corymbosa var. corymbosa TaxID=529605 RepID=A0AAV1BVT2_OLDCO|nr:OLC1v1021498C1 [Oldenlandia corymbosa var. corymbosa]